MTSWVTENATPNEGALTLPSKLELFKQKHPGAHTNDDVKSLNLKPEQQREHPRAWLVLVDSEDTDWGMVEDTLGDMLWQPGKGDIVGTWTRSKVDNRIHISLLSSVNALESRSIAIWSKYAEERKVKKAAGKKPRAVRKPVEIPSPEISIEDKVYFNSLRAKLRRAKSA